MPPTGGSAPNPKDRKMEMESMTKEIGAKR